MTDKIKKIGVLVSGGGTNLQALIDAQSRALPSKPPCFVCVFIIVSPGRLCNSQTVHTFPGIFQHFM